ncbi:methyltransferase domain-containing protein [Hymenobacter tibetensis]|uniref:Methyltransferase domain-containing protein n=1 Tax=Hymenobacter tibetensis TaxID=497967 RepID=A0ABY4CTY6_9BACT|nr:methyltransferase domain-containing protein [Hymenobacter tibetensis]UOG73730.1 methyltransferase domain-containing protein [Hymenobacter tibetensis]
MQQPGPSQSASYPPPPVDATPNEQLEYDRGLWNHFLLDATWRNTRFNAQPNRLLLEAVEDCRAGKALDVNMGEGRNALYLAQQGWQVTGVDIADQALVYAQQQAQRLGVCLTTIEHDANTYNWGTNQWDLIVLCYADEGTHVAQVQAALRPGGLLVFENFHVEVNQTRNNQSGKTIGFATNELQHLYAAANFQIIRYEEPLSVADFSKETCRLVKLVAQKI